MQTSTGKKAIAIFFFIFAAGLMTFLITQGVDLYQTSKGFVGSTAEPSVNCIAYFYELSRISYDNEILNLYIRNLDYSKNIESITVVGESVEHIQLNLPSGNSQELTINTNLTTNFSIFPTGCAVYRTNCVIATGECSTE